MYTEKQVGALKQIGNEWQKGDYHRIYFNNLSKYLGLKVRCYNSGNISSATQDGRKISNSEAKRIRGRVHNFYTKVWFDLTRGKFQWQIDPNYGARPDEIERILNGIKAEMNELVEA